MMLYTNVTRIKHFFLVGFPGLSSEYYGPVSFLLFVLFMAIAVGNIFILVFVKCERSLHKPTYLIFCHLALTDLLFGTVTLPRVISKYWFNDNIISFYGCFAQMYFVHCIGAVHSFILMVMAFDRFIAICAPLHYTAFFTNATVSVLCGISWFMPVSWMVGIVLHALTLPFCDKNIIVQCYCDHIAITSLGCENVREVQVIAFGLAMFSLLVPVGFIVISYFAIIVTVIRMSSPESRIKTLSTCTPQLLVTFLYYMPRCFVYLANNVGFTFSVPVRIVVVMMYSLLPAAINPIIYCFKTKDIKENLKKKIFKRKINIFSLFLYIMKYTNITTIKYFNITGFPGLPPEYYGPVSVLLLLIFLAIVVGNAFILVVIMYERTLHKPTYWIFFHLAVTDISFGIVTLPKVIAIYWWNDVISSFGACFTQMYFVHSLGAIHSLILLIMALDRFVAIWFPFQYPVVITNKTATIACSLCWVLTFIRMLGIVLHAVTLPYCDQNIIKQCYCDHISITQLGCGENVVYVKSVALGNALVTLLVPLTFIISSYFSIIIAALKMSHAVGCHKVLSTCAPQILITCLYYVPRCFVYLAHHLGFSLDNDARVVITMTYSLIPAVVNPIIYCFKTKEIKEALIKRLKNRKVSASIKSGHKQNMK
uniref:olfactory receptor 1E3-like n=1 Tax=Scatophagus argus TaxID=75038 RepID=UPI001ED86251|nr:olfactory receptor 1E3-like [Scatophagus argus]